MKKITLLLFVLFAIKCAFTQPNLPPEVADSLWKTWKNENLHDTARLEAIHDYAWNGYLFTQPDSAFYYAQLGNEFVETLIKRKGNSKLLLKYKGASLNTQGASYYIRGNYARAIDYFTQGLKIKEEIGDQIGIAGSLSNIGLIYKELGDFDRSLENIKRALEIEKRMGDQQGVGNSLSNIGGIYHAQEKHDLALDYYKQSLKILEEVDDKRGMAGTLNNIGVIYQDLEKYDLALVYFEQSLALRIEIGDQRAVASSLNNIGNNYKRQNNFSKALEYSLRSIEITQKIGAATQTKHAAQSLWEIYKKLGRYKESLNMHELFIATRDSIESEENQQEVIRQEYKYEYEKQAALDSATFAQKQKLADATIAKQEAESEKKDAELRAKRNQQYALFGGLALLILFGGFMYNRFRITRKQKGIIEHQKSEVEKQKEVIEEAHKEITDSIQYAKRIQSAILPPEKMVKKHLPESFILYKPKDVVAGDFYWMEQTKDSILIAAADCTGHGVPGAMVSVVCNNGLNRSVREYGLKDPGKILDQTREIVIQEFEKSEEEVKDGMDIALISLKKSAQSEFEHESVGHLEPVERSHSTLSYAGAHNPLWIIRKGAQKIEEIKADKQPIGKFDHPQPFTSHTVELQKGDTIYIFSDGFADQFGGDKGKKYKTANLKRLLLSVQDKNMDEQYASIDAAFEEWKGLLEQLDDVCLIGVKV